jgi:SAM-dependent methyltransferase
MPAHLEKPRLKDICRELAANFAFKIPAIRNYRLREGRTQSHSQPPESLLRQSFDNQFETIKRVFGATGLQGKRFLELGPGDSMPIGLAALALGAAQYIGCDRFPGDIAGASARALYELVCARLPVELLDALRARGLEPGTFPWLPTSPGDPPVVRFVAVAAERVHDALPPESVDVVFSYNVIEHVADPFATFASAYRVLRPGGVMLHRVDYGPHACWLSYQNPLLFLTVAEPVWRAMGSNRGTPNRFRHPEIIAAMTRAGFTTQTLDTQLCDAAFAEAIRPRLVRAKDISVPELQILNSLLLATKPA